MIWEETSLNQEGKSRSALSSVSITQPIEGLGQTKGQREGVVVAFVRLAQSRLTGEGSLKKEFPVNTSWWAHPRGIFLAGLAEMGRPTLKVEGVIPWV